MKVDDERLQEELAAHLEALTAEFERAGLAPQEAQRRARLRLGGEEQIRMLWREALRWAWLERWGCDLQVALRGLRRSPGYTLAVVVTLALAIAANLAIFSVVDAFLLRPLPYAQPQQLMLIRGVPAPGYTSPLSFPMFRQWREHNRSFSAMSTISDTDAVLTGHGEAVHLNGVIVTTGLFRLLGVQPAAGRFFLPSEAHPHADGGSDAIVISHKLFERRFGGSAAAIGQAVTLSGNEFTLTGVAPPGFTFPLGTAADYWITTAAYAEPDPGFPRGIGTERSTLFLQAVGRLRPGVTAAMAERNLNRISAAWRGKRHQSGIYPNASVAPLKQARVAFIRRLLDLLWVGAGLVMLIACANLAGLALARGMARLPDLRLRVALGARPRDLLRSLLSETIVLAGAGCGLGLALAAPVVGTLRSGVGVPGLVPRIGLPMLAYAAAAGLAAALLIGCWPAWAAAQGASARVSGRVSASRSTQRSRSLLVAAEVGLALLLVAAAGLLGRTFYALAHTDPGFNPQHVLVARLTLPEAMPSGQRPAVYAALLRRVRALPGVTSAAAGGQIPWSGNWDRMSAKSAAGHRLANPIGFEVSPLTPGYFHTLQLSLLRGRAFTRTDSAQSAPVVIINQRLLQKLRASVPSFPAGAIGSTITLNAAHERPRTIVGVVANVTMPGEHASAAMYWPYAQRHNGSLSVLVRTVGDPMALLPALRKQLAAVDPDLALGGAQLLAANRGNWAAQPEIAALMAGAFGLFALLLAATGLYGLIAYAVRQREQELGIRVALGAQRADIYRLVLGLAARLMLLGLLCGAVGIYWLLPLLTAHLYGLSALDPATLATAAAVLAAVALLAAFWPARRAARSDPMRALRTE